MVRRPPLATRLLSPPRATTRKKDSRLLRSPLLHFLLLGGLLFVLQVAWSSMPEEPVVEVSRGEIDARIEAYRLQMGRLPNDSETEAIERQVIEEAIWLDQAFAIGLHEVDSVVRQRLVLNMRFLEGDTEASDEALFARALELGMDRSDTVVRRRMVDRVQAIVRAGVRARPQEDAVLRQHYEETAERWREPTLLDFSHVYLSRDKRGDATTEDALALLERLRDEEVPVDVGIGLGDPFLAGHRIRGATPNRIIARLGPAFATGVEAEPSLRWVGPIESAFGSHLVWIHERTESRIPAFEEVRARVVEDWIEAESRQALRDQIEQMREQVEVRIIEDAADRATASS